MIDFAIQKGLAAQLVTGLPLKSELSNLHQTIE
jgi:hypothetical protein